MLESSFFFEGWSQLDWPQQSYGISSLSLLTETGVIYVHYLVQTVSFLVKQSGRLCVMQVPHCSLLAKDLPSSTLPASAHDTPVLASPAQRRYLMITDEASNFARNMRRPSLSVRLLQS